MSNTKETIIEAEIVRTDLAMMKLENDTIMAACAMRPRQIANIKTQLTEMLDAFPDLADAAIYEKPVGKGDDGNQKTATGLSIRAAESLAELYGYCRIRSDVTPLDENSVKVEATFTDYQNGRVWQDGGIVSKWYRSRDGKMVKHPDDRFYDVVVKAAASKRIREVILRSVNASLKAWFFDECSKRCDALLTDDKVRSMVKQFGTIGVTEQHLEKFIGRPSALGWTAEDRRKLLGVWNAIKEGETTVAQAFGPRDETTAEPLSNVTDTVKAKAKPAEREPGEEG